MIELGALVPDPQVELRDDAGAIGRVDFLWHGLALAGEFDGKARYTSGEMLRGRDPGEVVWAKKRREDRLRRLGLRVLRWTWDDVVDEARFARLLGGAGVPLDRGASDANLWSSRGRTTVRVLRARRR
jgi:hypothetical protein